MSDHYRIALMSAFIGNGGKTGSITFTDAAMKQLNEYGVDVYTFSDADIELLKSNSCPFFSHRLLRTNQCNVIWFNYCICRKQMMFC